MLNICILFNESNLVLMDEVVNIAALLYEACSKELIITCLEVDKDVKDHHDQIVSFMRACIRSAMKRSHELVHKSVNRH